MYQPRISQLIEALERVKDRHGDIEVQGYDEEAGVAYDHVDAEYNGDEGSFCLVTMAQEDA